MRPPGPEDRAGREFWSVRAYRALLDLLASDDFWREHADDASEVFGGVAREARSRRGWPGELVALARETAVLARITCRDHLWSPVSRAHRSAWQVALALGLIVTTGLGLHHALSRAVVDPLPYGEPEGLVRAFVSVPGAGHPELSFSWGQYHRLRAGSRTMSDLGVYGSGRAVNLSHGGQTRQVYASRATRSLFDALRVPPRVGRLFSTAEEGPQGRRVALVAHELWRDGFGGDPETVGSSVSLDGVPHLIVGIMPEGFRLPSDVAPHERALLWVPYRLAPTLDPFAGSQSFHLIGRLKAERDAEDAATEVTSLMHSISDGGGAPGNLDGLVRRLDHDLLGVSTARLRILTTVLVLLTLLAIVRGLDVRAGRRVEGPGPPFSAVITLEIAYAVLVVACAISLVRSADRLRRTDAGWDPTSAVVAGVSLPPARYPGPDAQLAFYERLVDAVRGIDGVHDVGLTSRLPMDSRARDVTFEIAGHDAQTTGQWPNAELTLVSPEFFAVAGIELVAGVGFGERDDDLGRVLVNETLVRKYWGGGDPRGAIIRLPQGRGEFRVDGVVADVRNRGIERATRPEVYLDYRGEAERGRLIHGLYLVMKTRADVTGLTRQLGALTHRLDATVAVGDVRPAGEPITETLERVREVAAFAVGLAILVLLIVAFGVYGVVRRAVVRRREYRAGRDERAVRPHPGRVYAMLRWGPPALVGLAVGALLTLGLAPDLPRTIAIPGGYDRLTLTTSLMVVSGTALFTALLASARVTRARSS